MSTNLPSNFTAKELKMIRIWKKNDICPEAFTLALFVLVKYWHPSICTNIEKSLISYSRFIRQSIILLLHIIL